LGGHDGWGEGGYLADNWEEESGTTEGVEGQRGWGLRFTALLGILKNCKSRKEDDESSQVLQAKDGRHYMMPRTASLSFKVPNSSRIVIDLPETVVACAKVSW